MPPVSDTAFGDSRWAVFCLSPAYAAHPCERTVFEQVEAHRRTSHPAMPMDAYYAWFRRSEALFDAEGRVGTDGQRQSWHVHWKKFPQATFQAALAQLLRPHPTHAEAFEAAVHQIREGERAPVRRRRH